MSALNGPGSHYEHAFAVPAYGQSPYLAECLKSLSLQTCPSPVVVCTSTPYEGLEELVARHGANLVVHSPNQGIGHDWNVALEQADARWVTLAHQDDVYLPGFAERTLEAIRAGSDLRLVFTNYGELLDGSIRNISPMLLIKRLLLELGFLGRKTIASSGARERLLRFGCPIPCPSVTLRLSQQTPRFDEALKVNLDWDAWLHMARQSGAFAWVRECLMLHRIHADSETSDGIRGGIRACEDLMMFRRLWPRPFADWLARGYASSYETGNPK